MSTSMTTALIYTRVSSEEQAREGVSLDAQLGECRRYGAQHGWVVGPEYQDVLSGKRDDRPAYQALLAEVRRVRAMGQPVVVVVFRLDRLGRRILERVRCREELKTLGVPVHSVREGGEVSDLVSNVLAAVAEEEIRTLGERVSVAKQHIAEGGWYVGGRAPWGYRSRPATPEERAQGAPTMVLEADPVEMPWVQETFRRAATGETIQAVYRWIRLLPSDARGGRAMPYQAVRKLMASPIYIARPLHGNSDVLARPPARWPALVDDATWQRIREHVAQHRHVPRQASRRYLLAGFLRCHACGARMHGHMRHGVPRYRCTAARLGAEARIRACYCELRGEPLETMVREQIASVVDVAVTNVPELRAALDRAWAVLRTPATLQDELQERQRQHLLRAVEQARARLTKAAVLFADGDIDKPGYELLRDKARLDLDAATEALDRLQVVEPGIALPPLETVLAAAEGWGAAMREGDVAARREVLAALIDRVVPVRVGRGQYDVEVSWTPLGEGLRAVAVPSAGIPERSAA